MNVGAIFLVQAALGRLVIIEDRNIQSTGKKRLHPDIITRFKRAIIAEVIIGALYLLSVLPIFWGIEYSNRAKQIHHLVVIVCDFLRGTQHWDEKEKVRPVRAGCSVISSTNAAN